MAVVRGLMERGDGADGTVALRGLFALVVDDDPAIATSLGDVLRGQGCAVIQLHDGAAALDCALHETPDVVLADLRMPGLPGARLTRRLREDAVLRDVPIVLLSWQEDWLAEARRVAEGPTGYLRKRSDAETVLSRVRGVLEKRTELEIRMGADTEVSGSLEDVTAHRLLRMASCLRPDARLSVRDATSLCEVQIRHGVPLTATCVCTQGTVLQGAEALDALLRVRVGRFVLTTERGHVQSQLRGTLSSQLEAGAARLRSGADDVPQPQVHTEPMFFRSAPVPAAPVVAPRRALRRWAMAAAVVAVGATGIALGALLRVLQGI